MSADYYMPLGFGLTSRDVRHYYDQNLPLAAHELVIRPLLYNSECAYVYGLDSGSELYINNRDILIKEKGKFKFDVSQECIKGHELIWNVQRWTRGSIVIVCKPERIDFKSILSGCFYVGIAATPNTGNTLAATKFCKKEAANGYLAFCFPASNGLDSMQLYVDEPLKASLLKESFKYLPDFRNRR
ncbi:hypothetical protein KXD93_09185 [Mucilaginibacter sp. BJC16-A38]|uniref:hypothetical protein n=1 Tax=Mucilaginibacter phenanthrenivorans TaxID=1234842 RepID=UPI002157A2C4|nr:hypothetical protein [Mucilaginibacter phenanthrenivorans]MCR8557814.1 hypothetical protein [Mucilaginibacter phenanthrenivorans]